VKTVISKAWPMNTLVDYIKEVRSELTKVVWPKRKEVIRLTLTILLISGIVGVYLGVLDYTLTKLLELLIAT